MGLFSLKGVIITLLAAGIGGAVSDGVEKGLYALDEAWRENHPDNDDDTDDEDE